jgi:carbon-monoxide dehydrogenase medium subunit
VKPPRFKYAVPESVEEAVAILDEHGDEAKVLAGGQSLIPLMNMRLARPGVLVDINRISSLDGIQKNGALTIGAITRLGAVARSQDVASYAPIVVAAMPHVGHAGIRSRGTFGGTAAHADPAAEMPTVLLALDAEITAQGPNGERTISAEDLFVTTFTTSLAENEVLTRVSLPYPTDSASSSFHEVARRHGDFALVGVAAVCELDGSGTCKKARIALSGVADTPVRAKEAEESLVGKAIDASAADAAGNLAADKLSPPSDFHASSAYRKDVARSLVTRALKQLSSQGGRP